VKLVTAKLVTAVARYRSIPVAPAGTS